MPYGVSAKKDGLAEFQQALIGTWQNDPGLTEGDKPLSFNVMPLPQKVVQERAGSANDGSDYAGFILKNFAFTETIRFNGTSSAGDPKDLQDPNALAVVAGAPNRGGSYTQFANAVFYEQQVRFAEGPADGKIVHIENGAWLQLGSTHQNIGPYAVEPPEEIGEQILRQPPYVTIAKQIAVPHGNSVLALGNVDISANGKFDADKSGTKAKTVLPGRPVIPDQFVPYPQPVEFAPAPAYPEVQGIATDPFFDPYANLLNDEASGDFENPNKAWTLNPNLPLQRALAKIKPKSHMHWRVTTLPLFGGDASVTNVPFEERKSKVTEYWADYWLLSSKAAKPKDPGQFDYLLYNQTVLMEMEVSTDDGKSYRKYVFPHITSNAVKKVAGNPTKAREATKTEIK